MAQTARPPGRPAAYHEQLMVVAKTLANAYGSAEQARDHLATLIASYAGHPHPPEWLPPAPPTPTTIRNWRANPDIRLDTHLIDEYREEARNFVIGSGHRIAAAAEARLLLELSSGTAADAKNAAVAWGIAVDKLNGRFGVAPSASAPPLPQGMAAFITFGPAPAPAEQVRLQSPQNPYAQPDIDGGRDAIEVSFLDTSGNASAAGRDDEDDE